MRLKEKGALGVLTVAVGEHLLANLLAVFVVVEITGCSISVHWLFLMCIWSVEFYQLFFPLSFLLHNILSDKLASFLTLVFVVLFPFPVVIFAHHMRLAAKARLKSIAASA